MPSRSLLLVLVFAGVLTACSDPAPANNGSDNGATNNEAFRGSTVTKTIGPDGGTVAVEVPGGAGLSLNVPAGALPDQTEISLTPLGQTAESWLRVEVAPAGLRFNAPATLTASAASSSDAEFPNLLSVTDGEKLSPLATTLSGNELSAAIVRLGYAGADEPADRLRRQALGPSNVTQAGTISCDGRLNAAKLQLQQLLADPGVVEVALQLYQTQLAIIEEQACEGFHEQLEDDIGTIACDEYRRVRDRAENSTISQPGDFRKLVIPIVDWAGNAAAGGLDCASGFDTVLREQSTRFLSWYVGYLDVLNRQNFSTMRAELLTLLRLYEDMLALGLADQAQQLIDELFRPTADRIRESAYVAARSSEQVMPLTYITKAGVGLPRPIIGAKPPRADGEACTEDDDCLGRCSTQSVCEDGGAAAPPNEGLPFTFDDADVHADIQYVNSSTTLTSSDATGTVVGSVSLGGGAMPGSHTTSGTLAFREDGQLTLSGSILGFNCWNGGDLDANDALIVAIDGKEFARLSANGNGNFLANDVTIDVAADFATAGVPLIAGQTYSLTVTRQRPLSGERQNYCSEFLLGPTTFEMFRVELTASSGAACAAGTLSLSPSRAMLQFDSSTPPGPITFRTGIPAKINAGIWGSVSDATELVIDPSDPESGASIIHRTSQVIEVVASCPEDTSIQTTGSLTIMAPEWLSGCDTGGGSYQGTIQPTATPTDPVMCGYPGTMNGTYEFRAELYQESDGTWSPRIQLTLADGRGLGFNSPQDFSDWNLGSVDGDTTDPANDGPVYGDTLHISGSDSGVNGNASDGLNCPGVGAESFEYSLSLGAKVCDPDS